VTDLLDAPAIVPGVYDIPEADYHRDPVPGGSLSSSGARKLLPPSCPAIFRHEQLNPPPPKKVFDLGSAAHKLVLGSGPDLVRIDADEWRTNEVKEQVAKVRERGGIPLKPAEYQQVHDMAAALRRHPVAAALFDPAHGRPEQTLIWQDTDTGVSCRARLDWQPDPGPGRMILPDYKGLALDTPIPTPDGWTTMGALSVGDQVFDSSGTPCTVTHKSDVHFRRCYRVRFDDGSTVVCDDEHLWVTTSGGRQNKTTTAVVNTEHIRQTLRRYGQCHHRVKVAGALDLPESNLPIHPYVFGCWLGDGTKSQGRISKPDTELFDRIAALGYRIGAAQNDGKCPTRTIYGLRKQLREAGLLGRRHIPDAYLRASREQRLLLLRGLMDTDGSWNATRQQAVFTSTDKALALSVRELACSLGQRAVLHTASQRGFGLVVEAYQVTFTPIHGLNPFALTRKADKVLVRSETRSRQRVIVAVEDMVTVPTQCVAVDSPDHTYLCTEAMIPTHNTTRSAEPRAVARAVHEHGYHQQTEWYLRGAQTLGLADEDAAFVFVFQEKDPPYLVTVVQLDDDALYVARERNRRAMELYADCVEADYWPGYPDDRIHTISLPAWATREENL